MNQDKRHLTLLAAEASLSTSHERDVPEPRIAERGGAKRGASVRGGVSPARVSERDEMCAGDYPDELGEVEPGDYLQVGDLAKVTGKTVRAIHLYESLGLLEPARRSRGGYRLFSPASPGRVRWITKLQSLGLSLSEIQGIAERRRSSGNAKIASSALLSVYETKLAEIRERLAEYRALEQELVASVNYLQTCQHACVGETQVSGCSRCDRHQDEPVVPELVSGARI